MHTAFHPEMNEAARQDALFHASMGYNKILVCWDADRDDEARKAFRSARCRPSSITFRKAGEWVRRNTDGYTALVTFDAFERLQDTDMEILLD